MRPRLASWTHAVVDAAGGWPVRLPDGRRARVVARTRHVITGFEPEVTASFVAEAAQASRVLDAGAHWGLFSLLAAGAGASVTAIEADPVNAGLLARNLRLSGYENRATVVEAAVGDRSGPIAFHRYEGESWGKSMMGGTRPQQFTTPTQVRGVTIDELGQAPDLIKIDVEGAELSVVRGARRTLADHRPVLIIEVHVGRIGSEEAAELREELRGLDYAITEIAATDPAARDATVHWLARPVPAL